jgi:hypothetical protein
MKKVSGSASSSMSRSSMESTISTMEFSSSRQRVKNFFTMRMDGLP